MEPFAIELLGARELTYGNQRTGENTGGFGSNRYVGEVTRDGVSVVENAKSFVVLIFAGVLASKGEQKLDVVWTIRIPFVRDDTLFAIEQLIDGDRLPMGAASLSKSSLRSLMRSARES
jgi:hypothetical protein